MKKKVFVAWMVCGVLFTGLMSRDLQAIEILTKEDFVNNVVVTEHLIKTADNAIILFDTSDSMTKPYLNTGMSRYEVAKKALTERNTLFPDLGHKMGLYSYGPWKAYYPVQPYNREKFAAALASLPEKPGGPTTLQWALRELDSVLENLSGRTVVFLISDGSYTREGEAPRTDVPYVDSTAPLYMGKKLAAKYNVCFCLISTADDAASQAVLKRLGAVSPCSIAIPFERFIDRPEYNSGMLFMVKSTVDVVTTTETKMTGVKVDNVLFDLGQYGIRPESEQNLNELGRFMAAHPDSYAVIAGYTCGLGAEAYNVNLSKSRATAVAKYLENKFKIDADRLVTLWYGKLNPVGDNNTEEGRLMNRRVEIAVGGVESM